MTSGGGFKSESQDSPFREHFHCVNVGPVCLNSNMFVCIGSHVIYHLSGLEKPELVLLRVHPIYYIISKRLEPSAFALCVQSGW